MQRSGRIRYALTLALAITMLLVPAAASGSSAPEIRESDPGVGEPTTTIDGYSVADLRRRGQFAQRVATTLAHHERHSDFAGIHFEEDGRAVVSFVSADQARDASIANQLAGGLGVEVRQVDYSQSELEAAMAEAWEVWPYELDSLVSVGVDVARNALLFGVNLADPRLPSIADEMSSLLGVPVRAVFENPDEETVCTGREYCFSPMEAGILVRKGSTTAPGICTMGFHVRSGSNHYFLTSGHCGCDGSVYWYHKPYGYVGIETQNLYNRFELYPQDAMSVSLSSSQVSDNVYPGYEVGHARNPYQGETVCASRGVANLIDCGTVTTVHSTWWGGTCGCTIYGSKTSGISADLGDSGSPVFVVDGLPDNREVAVGVLATSGGSFARMQSVLDKMGYSLYTG